MKVITETVSSGPTSKVPMPAAIFLCRRKEFQKGYKCLSVTDLYNRHATIYIALEIEKNEVI